MNGTFDVRKQNQRDFWLGIFCVIVASCFLFGHIISNGPLVYLGSLLLFVLFIIYSDRLLFIELFLLPFANIIKLSAGQACLLSYFVILGVIAYIIRRKGRIKFDISFFLPVALFLLLFLKVLVQSFELAPNYIRTIITMFIVSIVFVNDFKCENQENHLVEKAVVFLSVGVLLASLSGFLFFDNSKLSLFFSNTDHYYMGKELYSRFCGLSTDPNYYSSFALIGVASNLFMYIKNKKTHNIILAIALGIFGILSLSKMYLILLAICMVFFFVALIRKDLVRKRAAITTLLIATIVVFLIVYAINHLEVFKVVLYRINNSESIDRLTTGRSTIWLDYIKAIFSSISNTLVGIYSDEAIVGINHTHNTILQIVWKLGFVGLSLFLVWLIGLRKKIQGSGPIGIGMILIGIFGPAMALDMMVTDTIYWFYLLYLYILLDYNFKNKQKD